MQKFLFAYCNSPQTKAPPANLMFERKLNHLIPSKDNNGSTEQIEHLTQNQLKSKLQSKTYFNQKRRSQILNISKSSKFFNQATKSKRTKASVSLPSVYCSIFQWNHAHFLVRNRQIYQKQKYQLFETSFQVGSIQILQRG